MPVERRRRHRAAPRADVLRASACGRAPRRAGAAASTSSSRVANRRGIRPGRALGGVPRAEVLDHRLRVHPRLRVGGELLHRRRAAEPRPPSRAARRGSARPSSGVRIAGLELRERRRVDLRDRPIAASAAITNNGRSGWKTQAQVGRLVGDVAVPLQPVRARFLESPLVRGAGALSRLAGRGGGTTLPGKLLWKLDPGAIDALAARLPAGLGRSSRRRTARRRRPRWSRRSCGRACASRTTTPARTSSPGVASTLLARARRRARAVRGRRGARCPEVARRVRPKALAARQPLPRPARPLRRARARRRALARRGRRPPRRAARRERRRPAGRRRSRAAAARRVLRRSTIRALARPALQHAADSKYCLRCGTPYDYAAAYVGHLGDYRCPNCGHARPPLDVVAREIELRGLDGAAFTLVAPEGDDARRARAARASTTSTTRSARRRSR